jgi:hypothetical protein
VLQLPLLLALLVSVLLLPLQLALLLAAMLALLAVLGLLCAEAGSTMAQLSSGKCRLSTLQHATPR